MWNSNIKAYSVQDDLTYLDPTPKKHLCALGEEIAVSIKLNVIAPEFLSCLDPFKSEQRCDKKSFSYSSKKVEPKG